MVDYGVKTMLNKKDKKHMIEICNIQFGHCEKMRLEIEKKIGKWINSYSPENLEPHPDLDSQYTYYLGFLTACDSILLQYGMEMLRDVDGHHWIRG